MKTFLLRSFLLLVFMLCCQKNNAMPVQTAVWRINYNTNRSTDSYGNTNKDVRFKFEVTSSNVVFTHAGSKLTDTSMYLLQCLPNGEVDELSSSHSNMGMEITQGALKNTELGNLIEEDLKQMTPKQASMRVLSLESVCELVSEGTGDTGLNNGDIRLNVYAVISNRDTIKVGKIDREMTFIHSIKKESSSKIHRYFKLEVTRPVIVDIAMETQWDTQVELSISSTKGGNIEGNITGPFHNLLLSPGIYHVLENYRATASTQVALVIHAVPVEEEPERPVEMSPYTPNVSHSYITSIVPVMAQTTPDSLRYPGKAIHSINYYDGLGRPEQTVQYGASPDGKKDWVSRTAYDRLGREHQQWLPSSVSRSFGYTSTNSLEGISATQYNDCYAYNRMVYEDSPLERIIERYGPGEAWQVGGHAVKSAYRFNQTADNCLFFTVGGTRENPVLVRKGFYSPNLLDVTRTTDEDGNRGEVFTDKEGHKVLERRFLSSIATTSASSDTYYVYDDYGNLCFVLSPEASAHYIANPVTALELYAYQYRYDYRNRCTGKKLPGTGWNSYVYDAADRLVFSRNSEQAKRGEWLCSLSDIYGNLVISGIYAASVSVETVNRLNVTATFTGKTTDYYGYSLPSSFLTLNKFTPQEVRYYDDYRYKQCSSKTFPASLGYVAKPGYPVRFGSDSDRILHKGRETGSLVRELGSSDGWVFTCFYYDYYGRPIQTRSSCLGRTSVQHQAYNFSGAVTSGCLEQTGISPFEKKYVYDHMGRLIDEQHIFDGSTTDFLFDYDDLGRLHRLCRKRGNDTLSTTNSYNIRSWLTEIHNSSFSQSLYYTDGNGTPCYNGDLSSMTWKCSDGVTHGYKYTYDGLNRLLSAAYGQGTAINANPNRFTEQVTGYDKNGNILGLKRYGQTGASSYGLIDNLALTLNGNQLKAVNDAVTTSVYNNGFEFKDGAKVATEYTYDTNGNLTKDLNKNIISIQYNMLNLPSIVSFSDGSTITYTYGADGTKLRTVHKIGSATTTTDYLGNVVYENGVAKLLLTGYGYVSLNDKKYHSFLQDYQGNNRVVVDSSGKVEETSHYYPFGGVFASTGNVQPYKYNGKELDAKKGLNWYDYGARMYDPTLGRWHTVDPLAEKFYGITPYNYCFDNPIKYIDPDGSQGRPARTMRRGPINGGRPNPYAFYPGGARPQSYRETTNFSYRGTGLRRQMPLEEQRYLQVTNTPGGNEVQMSRNNKRGQLFSGGFELANNYIDFRNRLVSLATTVKYGENGIIQKSLEMIINDPELAQKQLDYEAQARAIDEELGELDFTGKSLAEILEMSAERKDIIQERLGLSPKDILWNEFLTNPEAFQTAGTNRRVLPEFRQH